MEALFAAANVGTCGCDRIANWLATNIPSLPLDPAVVASGCSVGMQAAQNLVQEQLNRRYLNGVDNGLPVNAHGA